MFQFYNKIVKNELIENHVVNIRLLKRLLITLLARACVDVGKMFNKRLEAVFTIILMYKQKKVAQKLNENTQLSNLLTNIRCKIGEK